MKLYAISIMLIIILGACQRVDYYPDRPLPETIIRTIAHKGGGIFDDGNTFSGCLYGLAHFDGIECDLQKGYDNIPWLSHSQYLKNCDSSTLCFSLLKEKDISDIDSCMGKQKDFTRLEDIFNSMETQYPQTYISLDVKSWTPCNLSDVNIIHELNLEGQAIIHLTQKYHLENRVMVESETGDFLYYIKTHADFIETYLSTFGDFEAGISKALKGGFTGISFHFKYKDEITREQVDMIHRKGLKIQLWTISDTATYREAISLNPDFIQSDILPFNNN